MHDTLETVVDEEAQRKQQGKWSDLLDNAKAKKGQKLEEQDESKPPPTKLVEAIRKEKETVERKPSETVQQAVKCMCVHGQCPEGKSYCDLNKPCNKGWTGTLCDQPDKDNDRKPATDANKKKDTGPKDNRLRAKVIEDEEEDNIFSVRRISDDDYTEDLTSVSKNSSPSTFSKVTATDDTSWETQRVVANALKDTKAREQSQTALIQ